MKWQAIGASSVGTSHPICDLPCQDAHSYQVSDIGVVAAVSDGLGSAAQAATGARLAVDAATQFVQETIDQDIPANASGWCELLHLAFSRARAALEEKARSEGRPLQEYGTTLIVLIVTEEWLAVGHIGDGAVVVQHDNGDLETISKPERGEYANSVMPLTATLALDHVRLSVHQTPILNAALLTDGLQSLALNEATGAPYRPFFEPLFEAIGHELDVAETSSQLATFLGSERICARTGDDKTLVVIGRQQSNSEMSPEDLAVRRS